MLWCVVVCDLSMPPKKRGRKAGTPKRSLQPMDSDSDASQDPQPNLLKDAAKASQIFPGSDEDRDAPPPPAKKRKGAKKATNPPAPAKAARKKVNPPASTESRAPAPAQVDIPLVAMDPADAPKVVIQEPTFPHSDAPAQFVVVSPPPLTIRIPPRILTLRIPTRITLRIPLGRGVVAVVGRGRGRLLSLGRSSLSLTNRSAVSLSTSGRTPASGTEVPRSTRPGPNSSSGLRRTWI